ncbi:hypothetical protein J7384_17885 [Endozoicomonas sp. G2_1]|uniref:hypothetical protein n=1 Tax=Endozoicomonas sp. G2_1 TaxID=2821091 RepID=UPI001ADAC537|nr:hypothetical protein [Endozoicomonas sp. G2_1]MBO9492237.1 hypothetical protein [Endozoicomonas sp. G2_1]
MMKRMIALFLIALIAFLAVRFFGVEPTIESMSVAVVSVIGTASLICQVLVKVTSVTPSTKDDSYVKGAKMVLAEMQGWIDLIAVNLNSKDSRLPSSSDRRRGIR